MRFTAAPAVILAVLAVSSRTTSEELNSSKQNDNGYERTGSRIIRASGQAAAAHQAALSMSRNPAGAYAGGGEAASARSYKRKPNNHETEDEMNSDPKSGANMDEDENDGRRWGISERATEFKRSKQPRPMKSAYRSSAQHLYGASETDNGNADSMGRRWGTNQQRKSRRTSHRGGISNRGYEGAEQSLYGASYFGASGERSYEAEGAYSETGATEAGRLFARYGMGSYGSEAFAGGYGASEYQGGAYGAGEHEKPYGRGGYKAGAYGAGEYGVGAFGSGAYGAESYGAGAHERGAYGAGAYGFGAYGAGAYRAGAYGAGAYQAGETEGGANGAAQFEPKRLSAEYLFGKTKFRAVGASGSSGSGLGRYANAAREKEAAAFGAEVSRTEGGEETSNVGSSGSMTKMGIEGMGGEGSRGSNAAGGAAGAAEGAAFAAGAVGAAGAGGSAGAAGATGKARANGAAGAARSKTNKTSVKRLSGQARANKKNASVAAAGKEAEAAGTGSEAEMDQAHSRRKRAAGGAARLKANALRGNAAGIGGTAEASAKAASASAAAAKWQAAKRSKTPIPNDEESDEFDSSFEGLHGRRIGTPTATDQDEYDDDHPNKANGVWGSGGSGGNKNHGDVRSRTAIENEQASIEGMYSRRGAAKKRYSSRTATDDEGVAEGYEGIYGRRWARRGQAKSQSRGREDTSSENSRERQENNSEEEGSFEGLHGRRIGTPTKTDYDEEDDDNERYKKAPSNRFGQYALGAYRQQGSENNKSNGNKEKLRDIKCTSRGLEETLRLPDDSDKLRLYVARVLQRLQEALLKTTKRYA